MNILVVDDDRDAADSLAMALELFGHEVTVRYRAVDGIAAARQSRPDVILHDLGMPDLNGYRAVRCLRAEAQFENTLVVAVTAYDTSEARMRAQRAGFDAFLTKPADLDQLARILGEREASSAEKC